MKKIKLLQAAAAVVVSIFAVSPSTVRAATMSADVTTQTAADVVTAVQPTNLTSSQITADQFGSWYKPAAVDSKYTGFLERPFNLPAAGINGMVRSEVFEGLPGTPAAGTYAYTYQVSSLPNNKVQINDLEGVRFDFNSTPQSTGPLNGQQTHYLQVTGNTGALANFKAPSLVSGGGFDAPAALNFRVLQDAEGQLTQGSLTANFTAGLTPGQNSSIFAVVSKEAPEKLVTVNVRGGEFVDPTSTSKPQVWVADNDGRIVIPVPEPAAFLAWAGMLGAVAAVRRYRGRRAASDIVA